MHRMMRLPVVLVITMLWGCSGTLNAYYQSIQWAMENNQDIEWTLEQVSQYKLDLMYLRKGDQRNVVLRLMFSENGENKWMSGDYALFSIANGRIVRTAGMANYLDTVTDSGGDPLAAPGKIHQGLTWQHYIDWGPRYYNHRVTSTFTVITGKTVQLFGKTLPAVLVDEKVTTSSEKYNGKATWHNLFWYAPQTYQLLQSEQKLFPTGDIYNIRYASRIARIINGKS